MVKKRTMFSIGSKLTAAVITLSLLFSACAENKIPEELDSYEDICGEDNIYGNAGVRTDENNTPDDSECVMYEAAVICIITSSSDEQEHIIIIAYTV